MFVKADPALPVARVMLKLSSEEGVQQTAMIRPRRYSLSEDDIRYELRVMIRWCRWFSKSEFDWVALAAARYRDKHPLLTLDAPASRAA